MDLNKKSSCRLFKGDISVAVDKLIIVASEVCWFFCWSLFCAVFSVLSSFAIISLRKIIDRFNLIMFLLLGGC